MDYGAHVENYFKNIMFLEHIFAPLLKTCSKTLEIHVFSTWRNALQNPLYPMRFWEDFLHSCSKNAPKTLEMHAFPEREFDFSATILFNLKSLILIN